MSRDPFVQALTSVVDGTRKLEDFARVVIAGAVEDAFLRVSRDHGVEYSALVDAHLEDIVDKHSSAGGDGGLCGGKTAAGKRCPRRGVVKGYCRTHAEQLVRDQGLQAVAEAYQDSQRHTKHVTDPIVSALARVGAETVDPKFFLLADVPDAHDLF